jgi:hypothetical protein
MKQYQFLLILVLVCSYVLYYQELESFENKKMNDQLDLLTYSQFKPECCPSLYTSSIGCLCDTYNEFHTIQTRGGNRQCTL